MKAFGQIERILAVPRIVLAGLALAGLVLVATVVVPARDALAQDPHTAALQSIVKLSIRVPPDARSARTLGTEREGNGIVIDGNGLIVTIGYLIINPIRSWSRPPRASPSRPSSSATITTRASD